MNNVTRALRTLLGLALGLAVSAAAAHAQQPSPSRQKAADAKTRSTTSTKPDDEGDYAITSSLEIGYRGLRVEGDLNKYQSDLNYKPGPRLFDTSFLVRAGDGKRKGLVDSLLVTTTGWGADPYGNVRVSAENSQWFKFDGQYRRFRYFNYLNNIANPGYAAPARPVDPATGWHGMDVRQQVGDFDLTVLPKNNRVRLNFGYSPEGYSGPAYTSWHYGGDDFQLLSQARSRSNEFRVGADWRLGPVDFSLLQGLRRFSDDTTIDDQSRNLGANPTLGNSAYLNSITRLAPVRGTINYTRFTTHTLLAKRLDLTGRLVYSSARSSFNEAETVTGVNFNTRITNIPGAINPPNLLPLGQWNFVGNSKRPNTLGDFGVTYLATDRLRLSDTFRVETFQINGGDYYNGIFTMTRTNGTGAVTLNPFGTFYTFSKFRRVKNTVEGDYQFNDRYAVHFGYRYGAQRVERFAAGANLSNNGAVPITPESELEENRTSAFFGGFKARPVKTWTLFFDAERGTADRIFTRIGEYDYTNIRARSRYTPNRKLALNVNFISKEDSNPSSVEGVSLEDFGVNVKSRVFTSSVDYTANSKLSFSGGYNYNRLDSDARINYAYNSAVNGAIAGHALYFVRNYFFNFDVAAQPFSRLTFYAAYRINKDVGQGGRLADLPAGLYVASYPMSFQSPEGRLSLRVNRRIDWNVGYQYYNYNESRLVATGQSVRAQNYHAHMPYTSLRFYFGNGEK